MGRTFWRSLALAFSITIAVVLGVSILFFSGFLLYYFPYTDMGNVGNSIARILAPLLIVGAIVESLFLWSLKAFRVVSRAIAYVGWGLMGAAMSSNLWIFLATYP